MQYTRPMIELVFEIRRRVPASLKPSIKLANPDMFQELADYYFASKDVITKTLIKELFSLAGNPWVDITAEKPPEMPKQITKTYRGQTTLVDAPSDTSVTQPARPSRVYRGQVVD